MLIERLRAVALTLFGATCGPSSPPRTNVPPPVTTPDAGAPRVRVYAPVEARIENPERGFYRFVELTRETDLGWVRQGGDRIVFSYVRLDAFRASEISPAALAALERGLDTVRAAGLKVVLRFAYNDGPYPDSEPDAPLDRILGHIRQVAPVLRAHTDVILLVQAGFIGAWGEWHSSTHGLDTLAGKEAVLRALLDALPTERMTQVRYPEDRRRIIPEALDEASAFTGTPTARVGHHNDCFLASDTDEGTWPEGETARWQGVIADDGRFTPVGGESCRVNAPRSSCPTATAELARMRYSFLNRDWHPDVVRGWREGGCLDTIERGLGYRFALERAELPAAVRAGDAFRVRLTVRNAGWAAMFNPRPVRLVMIHGGAHTAVDFADLDPRRWAPGASVTFDGTFTLPVNARAEVGLALWLPDATPRLQSRPEYSVRLANEGLWDTSHGWNVFATLSARE
jgi:hypothetical protein